MPDTPYLDKILALTRDYTRVERGRTEHVRGHISRSSAVGKDMNARQKLLGADYNPHGGQAAIRREAAFWRWVQAGHKPEEFAAHLPEAEDANYPATISDALQKYYKDAAAAHPHEVERRKIMDRLFAAEFGGHLLMDPPDTPPEQWEDVLGEHVDPDILARAQQHATLPKGQRMPGQRLFKPLF